MNRMWEIQEVGMNRMWEIPEVGIIDEGHGNTLALEDDSLGCSDWKRRKTASRALYTSTLQSYEQP